MNRSLVHRELLSHKSSFLIWLGVVVGTTILIMLFYPSMETMGEQMKAMMEGLPEGMTKAFGMDPDLFTSLMGYYSTYYGMHIMMLSGCFTITLAGNILSKEEREGTADFLLTRPISRADILTSKLVAVGIFVVVFNLIQIAAALVTMLFLESGGIDYRTFFIMAAYGFLLNFLFAGLGVLLSLPARKGRSITGPLIGIVVGGFILKALSQISESSEWIGWISPFRYADFDLSQGDYGMNWVYVSVLIGGTVVSIVATYILFKRKDIFV